MLKKLNLKRVLLVLSMVFFFSCQIDETDILPLNGQVKTGELLQNETWTADKIYEISGKLIVPNGVVLTIEAGTIIKAKEGYGTNAAALVVARGGKIMAIGTADKPIIFTSVLDNISIGQKSGTNLDERDAAKWGGIIILGNAKVSAKVGDTQGHIEGLDADAIYGKYGGNDDMDNSGVLKYVSIRHGGISIGDGNEINGLTLGGVGAGTTIDYVEIVGNLDDGIECFGGSVIINHALVAYQGDDAFDIDQNFSGKFINSMVVYKSSVGDEFLEIDGPENTTNANGKFTVENCLFIDKDANGSCDFKSKAQGVVQNNEFVGLSKFKISLKLDADCTTVLTDAYSNYIDGNLKIEGNDTNAALKIYTKSVNGNDASCEVSEILQYQAQTVFLNANNQTETELLRVQEDEFYWSWTAINSKF